ncbi:MAG: SpoIIE family protein phosphatase [Spirochaetes bacterium]|nr:SpoIIE family protein phosphatase [Spirochaetota bacterium]
MELYFIIPLIVNTINAFALAYVYALDRRDPLNRAYCALTGCSVLWVGITLPLYLPIPEWLCPPLLKAAAAVWLPMGFLVMNLTYAALRRRRDTVYWAGLAAAAGCVAIAILTDLVVRRYRLYPWGAWQEEGPLFLPLLTVIIVVPVLYSMVLFALRCRVVTNPGRRLPLLLLILGPMLNLTAALFLEVVVPRLVDSSMPRLSPSSTIISSLLVFFAIMKYRILMPNMGEMVPGIFSSVRDGIILLGSAGEVLQMNSAATELFHPDRNDIDGVRMQDLINGYDPRNEYSDYEVTYRHNDRTQHLLITQSMIEENDRIIGRVLTTKDITPIKTLLDEVRQSEEQFRFLVEGISEAIYSIDINGMVDYVSPAICSIAGWKPDEIIGRNFSEFINPDDLPGVMKRFGEAIGGGSIPYEFRIRAADGTFRNVITTSKRIIVKDSVDGLRGVITDITEIRKIKQELQESQRLYRLIANNVTDKIWILDIATLRVTYISPSVLHLNGRSPEEEMAIPIEQRIEAESLNNALLVLQEEVAHDAERDPDRQRIIEFTERHADGRWINTEASITFIRDPRGWPVELLGVSRDITERKALEREIHDHIETLKKRNEMIEKDMATARIIHQRLLPVSIPLMDRFRIDFRYYPLEEVGGDYFNFINLEEGGLGVFIGDVTGHGISAALFLSLVKSITNTLMREYALDPSAFMYHLNNELYRYMQSYFITGAYGLFRGQDQSDVVNLTFANGGHPPLLLYKASLGEVETLYARGSAIGAFEQTRYFATTLELYRGDRIYLYTDGLVEAVNDKGEILGYDALPGIMARVHDANLQKTLDSIMREIHHFRGKTPLDDDIVLVGIEVV